MGSIVLELQREVYEHDTPISVLLRKAYTLAKKLKVTEFEKWCSLELNGYKSDEDEFPSYRRVLGEIKAFNPYVGYIPCLFPRELEEVVSTRSIGNPITEIEENYKKGSDGKGVLIYNFPAEQQRMFMDLTKSEFQISLHIPATQFGKIVDRVRNIILDWTLKLEEENVLGEEMTFSEKEKERASKTEGMIFNIIGSMTNSQLQQHTVNSEQKMEVGKQNIKEELNGIISETKKLYYEIKDAETKGELASEIKVLEAQVESPKPKNNIIAETLKSIRNIAEGTTGSLIASGIIGKIPVLLAMLYSGK